jgi:hypothetical protein
MSAYANPNERDRERIATLLDELERWNDGTRAVRLWRCPHCKADVDEPCHRPNGEVYANEYPTDRQCRYHAGRVDLMIAAKNTARVMITDARADLRGGKVPAAIITRVHRNRLYRRLVQLGKLTPPLVSVT